MVDLLLKVFLKYFISVLFMRQKNEMKKDLKLKKFEMCGIFVHLEK